MVWPWHVVMTGERERKLEPTLARERCVWADDPACAIACRVWSRGQSASLCVCVCVCLSLCMWRADHL